MGSFGADYAELWATASAVHHFGLDKTRDYMNWRYIDGPGRSVRVHALQDARGLAGVLVTGVCAEAGPGLAPGNTVGEILELIVRDPEDHEFVAAAIANAVTLLGNANVDSVRTTGLSTHYHEPLTDLGFQLDETSPHQLTINFDGSPQSSEVGPMDKWYLSAGDGPQLYSVTT